MFVLYLHKNMCCKMKLFRIDRHRYMYVTLKWDRFHSWFMHDLSFALNFAVRFIALSLCHWFHCVFEILFRWNGISIKSISFDCHRSELKIWFWLIMNNNTYLMLLFKYGKCIDVMLPNKVTNTSFYQHNKTKN